MYGYIYLTVNLINGKKYVGKKTSNKFDPNYFGSGIALNNAIKKYGKHNFCIHVLEELSDISTSVDLLKCEIKWQQKWNVVNNKEFYNMVLGQSVECLTHSPETIEKIRNSQIGIPKSEYYHSKQFSDKVKEGMRNGKTRTPHVYTKEENLQNSLRIRNYYKNGGINGMSGKKHSKETLKLLSEKAKQRPKKFGKETSCYGRRTVNNGFINKMVWKEEVEYYLMCGWCLGRVKKM